MARRDLAQGDPGTGRACRRGVRRLGGAGAPRPAPARYAPTPRSDLYRRERACTNRHRICAGRVGIIDGTANVRPPAILVQLSLSTAASSAPNAFGGQNADGVSGGSMVEGRPRCSRERGRGVLGPERPRLRAPGSRSRPARAGGARVTPDGHPKHGSRAPRTGRFWAAPTAKGKIALHASRGPSRGSPTGLPDSALGALFSLMPATDCSLRLPFSMPSGYRNVLRR